MIQILEPRESFGETVGRGFGQGASQGLMNGLSISQRMAEETRNANLQRQMAKEKRQHQLGMLDKKFGFQKDEQQRKLIDEHRKKLNLLRGIEKQYGLESGSLDDF